MKKLFCLALAMSLFLARPAHAERVNLLLTMTTGVPIRITTTSTKVDRLLIQNRHSSVGIITVLMGVPLATACSTSATPSQITAELGPGDSTHPGQSLSDPQGANGNAPSDYEDLQYACLAGTTSDQAIVSFWHRN